MRFQFRFPALPACVFPVANQFESKLIMDRIVNISGLAGCAPAFAGSAPAQKDTSGESSRIQWIGVVPCGTAPWQLRVVSRGQSSLNVLTGTPVLICGRFRIKASLSGLGLA